ncbi:hypothetical protein IVZ55_27310 [Salmonella enterica subsp. enterica serovar Worthington]|nr:hypothetical protein [Salmonella enterica subsp. enterica serovar Worthington]
MLNSKQISAAFFSGKLGMAMLSTGALGFMRENSKDFELGVAMLPAKEQRSADRRRQPQVLKASARRRRKQRIGSDLSGEPRGERRMEPLHRLLSPRKASYDTPEMKAYLQQDPRAAIALEQLKYAHPWYFTRETVAVRKAMENQLAAVVNDAKVRPEAAVQAAQKES